jgi:molybdopterin converting factor subunit 1
VFAVKFVEIAGLLAAQCSSGYNLQMPSVMPSIRVRVLFFGRLRELTGLAEEAEDLPAGATLAQVFERYTARYPSLAGFRNSMVVSRNQEFAAWDTRAAAGDEIAFLPPVSGG